MNKILFVDDDVAELAGLQHTLAPMARQWSMQFATSGKQALEMLGRTSFEIVVADVGMPDMDGVQLLSEVMHRHPDTVRIALLERPKEGTVVRSAGATHQYLTKPCSLQTLTETVARATALRSLLADEGLKKLVAQVRTLPSLPALYTRLVAECRSPRGSLKTVGEIIGEDVGMTAKILNLVNSAFFGLKTRVSSPVQAVQLLGLDTVKGLVLTAAVFSQFEQTRLGRFSIVTFWRHSLITGSFARIVATQERRDQHFANDASVAGMLHDAGQLILAAHLPDQYGQALELVTAGQRSLCEAEREVFGSTHATVGAYLLGLWGLPDAVVEAVAYHHNPSAAAERVFAPLTAVHVADAFADELIAVGEHGNPFDMRYLDAIRLAHRVAHWRERCKAFAGETRDDGGA
jgi:HD-like signal output (HDOD) protein